MVKGMNSRTAMFILPLHSSSSISFLADSNLLFVRVSPSSEYYNQYKHSSTDWRIQ